MATDQPYYSFLFEACVLLALCLPLLSFILSCSISEKYSWAVSFVASFLLLLSTVSAFYVFTLVWNHEPYTIQWKWFSIATFSFKAGIYLNNLSALMLLLVSFVSFLVHIYSTGYMAGDAGVKRYFAMLGFFTFSMLGIVVADNLILVFVFWELVGFSSYMLIGHWKEKTEAAAAAGKAFLINRIGDAGFLIGLMILWANAGTFNLQELSSLSPSLPWLVAGSLCIFCGVIGKSAQFPLLTWLPDAMEGPTPVSALIHAATMVAAGVFLMARVSFLFPPQALDIVACAGIITALMGGLAALVQTDIKKILAYSTISQLGLMITAIGAGSPGAAMLHLFTHAFFKACLFLSAGAVIHALHQVHHGAHIVFDVQDIRNLGGLRKKLPFTFLTFVISGSALAGLPFFSGFISKEAILTALLHWKGDTFSWRWIIIALAFVVSFITVIYIFRLIWTVFFNEENLTKGLAVTEPPAVMRAPLALLAIGSCWFIVSWNPFSASGWLMNPDAPHNTGLTIFSALWVITALAVAYFFHRKNKSLQSGILLNNFYLDWFYQQLVGRPTLQLASFTERFDKKWIDGFLHASAYAHVLAAHLTGWFDRAIIDGIVNGMASMARTMGSFTRSFQSGKIQLYIFWAVFTIIIFLISMLI